MRRPASGRKIREKVTDKPLTLDVAFGPTLPACLMLLGDDPSLAPLNRPLIERTEGNPFFLLVQGSSFLVMTSEVVGAVREPPRQPHG